MVVCKWERGVECRQVATRPIMMATDAGVGILVQLSGRARERLKPLYRAPRSPSASEAVRLGRLCCIGVSFSRAYLHLMHYYDLLRASALFLFLCGVLALVDLLNARHRGALAE